MIKCPCDDCNHRNHCGTFGTTCRTYEAWTLNGRYRADNRPKYAPGTDPKQAIVVHVGSETAAALIISALSGGALTVKELTLATGKCPSTVGAALKRLYDRGEIIRQRGAIGKQLLYANNADDLTARISKREPKTKVAYRLLSERAFTVLEFAGEMEVCPSGSRRILKQLYDGGLLWRAVSKLDKCNVYSTRKELVTARISSGSVSRKQINRKG